MIEIILTSLKRKYVINLGLLCTIGSQMDERLSKNRVLDIYGPIGLRKFITTSLSLARSPLPYKYNITELIPDKDQYPKDWDDWKVIATLVLFIKLIMTVFSKIAIL